MAIYHGPPRVKRNLWSKNAYRFVRFIYSLLTERDEIIFAPSFWHFCGVKQGLTPLKTPAAALDTADNMATLVVKGRVTWSLLPLAQGVELMRHSAHIYTWANTPHLTDNLTYRPYSWRTEHKWRRVWWLCYYDPWLPRPRWATDRSSGNVQDIHFSNQMIKRERFDFQNINIGDLGNRQVLRATYRRNSN